MMSRLLNTHPQVGCLTEVPLLSFFSRIEPLFAESIAHDALLGVARGSLLAAAETPSGGQGRDAPAEPARSSPIGDAPAVSEVTPGGGRTEPFPVFDKPASMPRQSSNRRWEAWLYSDNRESELTDLGVVDPHVFLQPARHGSRIAKALIEIASGKDNLACLGSKVPNQDPLDVARQLADRTPNIRFIHIMRRPSDVVNSSLARRNDTRDAVDMWHIHTVEDACDEWRVDWNRVSRARETLGDRMLLVRYDDVAAGRRHVLESIAQHLGIASTFDLRVFRPLPNEMRGYACTPQDDDVIRSSLGGIDAAWGQPLDDLFRQYPRLAPLLPENEVIRFGVGHQGHAYNDQGLSGAEDWGCWTDGEVVRFDVGLRRPGDLLLTFVCHVWRRDHGRPFEFVLTCGRSRQVVTIAAGQPSQIFERQARVPRAALDDPELLTMVLQMSETKSADEDPVADTRRLGLGLREIRVEFVGP